MRFLCDEMLVRLARLLRAGGYDTYLASDGESDAGLLKLARACSSPATSGWPPRRRRIRR
jgi:uncharacterized protein with PIN domain